MNAILLIAQVVGSMEAVEDNVTTQLEKNSCL